MVDNFSKFVFLSALPNREGDTIADFIFKQVVCIFGPPLILKSDNGGEFVNSLLKYICEKLSIKHYTIAPHNPAANGQAERHVGVAKGYLAR